jgi:hypothetical protein
VPAKAPLPEEAIFNRNKAATERRQTTCKAQHKEQEIAKRDWNDDRIKRQKEGERGVSPNEDSSPDPAWRGDEPSAAVDKSDMSGSSMQSPPRAVKVTSPRRLEPAAHEKSVGPRSWSVARPVREDQRATHSRTAPCGSGASEVWRDLPRRVDLPMRLEEPKPSPRHLLDGSDRLDMDSLQRHPSRVRTMSSASTLSALQGADSGADPRRLQSLIIQGGRAPDVYVSLPTGGGHGLTSDAAEVRRIAPE